MPIWTTLPKSPLAKSKNVARVMALTSKIRVKKSKVDISYQQIKDWINYFQIASEQQIHQAVHSQKFQVLPLEIKKKILKTARKLEFNLVTKEIKKPLEKY